MALVGVIALVLIRNTGRQEHFSSTSLSGCTASHHSFTHKLDMSLCLTLAWYEQLLVAVQASLAAQHHGSLAFVTGNSWWTLK